VPEGTQQLALIMDDADAPTPDPFVHWVVYGIAGDATEITDGNDEFTYGLNDTGTADWFGPCPPPGDGPHGYVFTLYALDAVIELPEDLDGRDLFTAIEPEVTLEAEVSATYERQ
jgi:Raf kinase inhibitor-like YbhB/YbcL family protein